MEVIIEEDPGRALEILRDIDVTNLKGRKQKAHYSLLKSMALDKNYIDLTIFDTLQPAIDYFLIKGNPNEKLRTNFYQGRIFQNRGEYTEAFKCLQKGMDLSNDISDSLTLARVFYTEGDILARFNNNAAGAKLQLQAAEIFSEFNKKESCCNSILSAVNNFILDDCFVEVDSIFSAIDEETLFDPLSEFVNEDRSRLFTLKTNYYRALSTDSLASFLKTAKIPDLLTINNKLIIIGNLISIDNLKAKEILSSIKTSEIGSDSIQYNIIKSQLFESLGDYKEAFFAFTEYSRMKNNDSHELLQQQAAIAEDNHQHELNLIKSRGRQRLLTLIIVFAGVVILLGIALSVYIARSINQKRKIALERANVAHLESQRLLMENRIKELETQQLKAKNKVLNSENSSLKELTQEKEREICRINDLLNSLREDKDRLEAMVADQRIIPEEVAGQVRNRIALLNALFYDYINDSEARTDHSDKLMFETIGNIDEFLNATRLSYKVAYPAFISYLESK
ncbi:MAG: hypothetical protein K2G64_03870, partial [Muribaculaceae bacterium]|nr:hypothetical protein [Muribaculaceae bacterium]